MMAYSKHQRKKEGETGRLRGEGDKFKIFPLKFERGQGAGFGTEEEGKTFH